MAFDEALAARIRELVATEPGMVEKHMFGGLAVLIGGNMACGVHRDSLMVRTDPAQQEAHLAEQGVRPFDLTGRPMKGWLLVDPPGFVADADLARWVARGVEFARSLPAK
jgi:TfoX/Sxy family transcriptional regulator of competence genes